MAKNVKMTQYGGPISGGRLLEGGVYRVFYGRNDVYLAVF